MRRGDPSQPPVATTPALAAAVRSTRSAVARPPPGSQWPPLLTRLPADESTGTVRCRFSRHRRPLPPKQIRDLYKAALFEVDNARLPERIAQAEKALRSEERRVGK